MGMMVTRRIEGTKLAYRPVDEAELSYDERRRVYGASNRQEARWGRRTGLVDAASCKRPRFDVLSRWIVATCRAGDEQAIAEELREQGMEVWCPLERFRKPPRRGLKAVDIYRPFFSGYVFVRVVPCDEAYAGVLTASRLGGLMSWNGRPYLMPPKIMDALMLASKKDDKDHRDEARLPFSIGQRVVIRSGPFADFLATVRRLMPNRWKMEAEVSLFGRMTPLEIDIDSIEP